MAESKKRERGSNFSNKEIEILIAIVKAHKETVECKKTDVATWRKKDATWERIAEIFNCNSSESFRSKKALKGKYEDIKKSIKKKLARNRMEGIETGVGESQIQTLTAIEENVLSMLPSSTEAIPSVWDCDQQSDNRQRDASNSDSWLSSMDKNDDMQMEINSPGRIILEGDGKLLADNDDDNIGEITIETEDPEAIKTNSRVATTGIAILSDNASTPELRIMDKRKKIQQKIPHDEIPNERDRRMKDELHEMKLKIFKAEFEIKVNQLFAERKIKAEQLKAAKIETEIKELEKQIKAAELKNLLQD